MVKLACRVSAAYLVAAFALSAQASAGKWNDVKALLPGTEIRLVSGQSTARGPIQSVTDDSVVLTTAKGQETFSRQQIDRLWQKRSGHRARNALIGAGIGAGAGLGIGLATSSCSHFCIVSPGLIRGALTAVGAVAGALIGVAIPSGGWKEVYKQ